MRLLQVNPEERLTSADALNHPWIENKTDVVPNPSNNRIGFIQPFTKKRQAIDDDLENSNIENGVKRRRKDQVL